MVMDEQHVIFPIRFTGEDHDSIALGNQFEKEVLKYGTIVHPSDPTVKINIDEALVDNVIKAFKGGALEKVPILMGTHDNSAVDKTCGVVKDVIKTDVGMSTVMEFTDGDLVDKIKTKTSDGKSLVSGVSVYLAPAATKEGKNYPLALWHVAVTNFPWITGLEDFKELAAANTPASLFTYPRYIQLENLSQRVTTVTNAFYDLADISSDFYSYVKEVHNDFIIVYDRIGLIRYSYTLVSDNIEFGDSERVEVQYVAASLEENMPEVNEEQVLEFVNKETGLKFASIEELKSNKTGIDALFAKFEIDGGDFEKLGESIAAANTENERLAAENKGLSNRVEKLETDNMNSNAESAVDKQIQLGKILPVQKDQYLAMYKSDSGMFDKLMEHQPVLVSTKEIGTSTGKSDLDGAGMSNEDVDENTKKYIGMITGNNGKEA